MTSTLVQRLIQIKPIEEPV
jgi:hypothetical protein